MEEGDGPSRHLCRLLAQHQLAALAGEEIVPHVHQRGTVLLQLCPQLKVGLRVQRERTPVRKILVEPLQPVRAVPQAAVEDELGEERVQLVILDESLVIQTQVLINKSQLLLKQKVLTEIPLCFVPLLPLGPDVLFKFVEDLVVGLEEELSELVKEGLHVTSGPAVSPGGISERHASLRSLPSNILLDPVKDCGSQWKFVAFPSLRCLHQDNHPVCSGANLSEPVDYVLLDVLSVHVNVCDVCPEGVKHRLSLDCTSRCLGHQFL